MTKTVKDLRIDAGLSLREAAERAGVGDTFLCHIEAGRRPLPHALIPRLATALGVDEQAIRRAAPPWSIQIADLPPAERAAIAAIVDAIRADVRARYSA